MGFALRTHLSKTSMLTPRLNKNLLETSIYNVRSRSNIMQSAQATPTSSSSPLDHQRSEIVNSGNDPSQSNYSSNNKPQHPPSTSEFKKKWKIWKRDTESI